VQAYPEDLESSFPTETIHFSELLKTELGKKKTGTEKVATELNMYHLITENALEGSLRNTEIALRMYLTMTVNNCTGEIILQAEKNKGCTAQHNEPESSE